MSSPKPSKFIKIEQFVREKEPKIAPKDEEIVMAKFAKSGAWKVLKDYINDLLINLETFNEVAISKGSPVEEIGKNAIVISLAKGIVYKVLNKVEDAEEASRGK